MFANVRELSANTRKEKTSVHGEGDSSRRQLDRRIKVASQGAREAAFSLAGAFSRAQDLIYIETPAFDTKTHGETNDTLNLFEKLTAALAFTKGLHVVLCFPSQLPPGTPRSLEDVRNAELIDTINGLRSAAGDRFAAFSPGAGSGRSVRLASTTVVVDDVYALVGTTHLWRKGLTFDSSFASAVFDEKVTDGRPAEIARFRRAILAGRLGVNPTLVPDDPGELVRAVRDLDLTRNFRLAQRPLRVPVPLTPGTPYPSATDRNIWNPDGANDDTNFANLLIFFANATSGASPGLEINDP